MRKPKIILLRSELGAGTRGASLGVDALKIAAIDLQSDYFKKHACIEVEDENWMLLGKIIFKYAKRIKGINKIYERLTKSIAKVCKKPNQFPVVLAGDHSTAGGTIAGIKAAFPNSNLGVVWIDAHADLHSPYTTPSGNIHGMPLATALAEDNLESQSNDIDEKTAALWERLKSVGGIAPKIKYPNLVYVGLRDTEAQEDYLINKHNVRVFRTKEVRQNGASETAEEILEYLKDCDKIYVSFDVDSLDPKISTGTGTPVPMGLKYKEARDLLNVLCKDPRLCCLEFVEINPTLDTENAMAETAFKLLESATEIAMQSN